MFHVISAWLDRLARKSAKPGSEDGKVSESAAWHGWPAGPGLLPGGTAIRGSTS